MKLKEITAGLSLTGVEPTQIVTVVATVPFGDGVLQLIYRTPDSMFVGASSGSCQSKNQAQRRLSQQTRPGTRLAT